MNTTLRKITNECFNTDISYFYKKVGNYAIKRTKTKIVHFYYEYPICIVDLNKKEFNLDSGWYKKSRLTTAQLNFLEIYYQNKNYKLKERR